MKNLILIFISVLLVGCESTGPKVTSDEKITGYFINI